MKGLFIKVWHDLWSDKLRTLQVVLVIALGAIAIGLVIGGRNLIADTVAYEWQRASPPHIRLSVNPPLDDDQLSALERIDGVAEVEGLMTAPIEWRFNDEDVWRTGTITARKDYDRQVMERYELLDGNWPTRNTLTIRSGTDIRAGVFAGDRIELRSGETERFFQVVGTADPIGPAPIFGQDIEVYADRRTFDRLVGRDTYNVVLARDLTFDQARAEATDLSIQDYFEEIGVDSVGTLFPFQDRIIPPDVPPGSTILNALFLVLGVIGVIVVILGIFLVYNSISAIITQQTSQIGVLKALGASSGQVLWSYIALVLSFGLLAALISIPIGGTAARLLQKLFIGFLNMADTGFRIDMVAIAVQIAICLVAPIIAALFPLKSGIGITVREAISSYGLADAISLVDRLVARVRSLPYVLLLVVANTFRNTRRVLFIQLTLVVAGAIFMMVMGVRDATRYTFGDRLAEIHNYQVTLSLDARERTERVQQLVEANPAITASELWLVVRGKARPIEQRDSEVTDARVTVFGQPATTDLYRPDIQQGRWFRPGETEVAVVHERLASVKGWEIGEWITFADADGRESDWQIVGITFDPAIDTSLYVPLSTLQRETGAVGRANTLWVQTVSLDGDYNALLAGSLADLLDSRGLNVAPRSTFGENTIQAIVDQRIEGFDLIIILLAIMAVIIALVGGFGLSGVLSLSVLERRREIGVMRSIGASTWQVVRIFVGEGLVLGLLSWLIALPLSIPAGYFMATQGLAFALNTQLIYRFTPTGAIYWLVIITLLAIVSSTFPARGAAKLSVRESLAYQ